MATDGTRDDSTPARRRGGDRALMDRDAGIERWLRDEVLPGHAEYLADPRSAVPVENVLARIKSCKD